MREIVVWVTVKTRDGSIEWSREFKAANMWIPPLETRPFATGISPTTSNTPENEWQIVSVWGYQP